MDRIIYTPRSKRMDFINHQDLSINSRILYPPLVVYKLFSRAFVHDNDNHRINIRSWESRLSLSLSLSLSGFDRSRFDKSSSMKFSKSANQRHKGLLATPISCVSILATSLLTGVTRLGSKPSDLELLFPLPSLYLTIFFFFFLLLRWIATLEQPTFNDCCEEPVSTSHSCSINLMCFLSSSRHVSRRHV